MLDSHWSFSVTGLPSESCVAGTRNHNRRVVMWLELRTAKSPSCLKRKLKKRAIPGSGFWHGFMRARGRTSLNEIEGKGLFEGPIRTDANRGCRISSSD
jgi:hypothetical protein